MHQRIFSREATFSLCSTAFSCNNLKLIEFRQKKVTSREKNLYWKSPYKKLIVLIVLFSETFLLNMVIFCGSLKLLISLLKGNAMQFHKTQLDFKDACGRFEMHQNFSHIPNLKYTAVHFFQLRLTQII